MTRLRSHLWWVLVAVAVVVALFGLGDVVAGIEADPAIVLGLAGLTLAELAAQSEAGYRLVDYGVRAGGLYLIVLGLLMLAVLFGAYRARRRWAWWAMWLLPALSVGISVLMLGFGVVEGQSPPPPMLSGPILAVVTAAVLVLDGPRFRGAGEDLAAAD